MNRLREWVVRQQCQRKGHKDTGCYSESGSTGVCCDRCGRTLWTRHGWEEPGPPRFQAPNYPTLYTGYGRRPFKGWWK